MNESNPGESAPTMRFGIADPSGRIVDTVATGSLVDAVRLFEDMAHQGFRCCPGQPHAGGDLLRVFQPTPSAPAMAPSEGGPSQRARRGHHE